jgi:hypothetical protein
VLAVVVDDEDVDDEDDEDDVVVEDDVDVEDVEDDVVVEDDVDVEDAEDDVVVEDDVDVVEVDEVVVVVATDIGLRPRKRYEAPLPSLPNTEAAGEPMRISGIESPERSAMEATEKANCAVGSPMIVNPISPFRSSVVMLAKLGEP